LYQHTVNRTKEVEKSQPFCNLDSDPNEVGTISKKTSLRCTLTILPMTRESNCCLQPQKIILHIEQEEKYKNKMFVEIPVGPVLFCSPISTIINLYSVFTKSQWKMSWSYTEDPGVCDLHCGPNISSH
jgi:hypothetical protein